MPDELTLERYPDAPGAREERDPQARRAAADMRRGTRCPDHRRFVHATYGYGKAALLGRAGYVQWCPAMRGWHIYPEEDQ